MVLRVLRSLLGNRVGADAVTGGRSTVLRVFLAMSTRAFFTGGDSASGGDADGGVAL